jgi:hypothetical protein
MAVQLTAIRQTDSARIAFSTRLEDRLFRFLFAWNVRACAWSMAVQDDEGNDLLAGYMLRAGENSLRSFATADLPGGRLVVVDTRGEGVDPGRFDFRGRSILIYVTEAEVVA